MAAIVYSECFFAEHQLDGSQSITADAGYTFVVRDVDVFCAAGVSAGLFVIGSNGQTIWAWAHDISTQGSGFDTGQWRGRQVIGENDLLKISTTGPLDVTVSGYRLTGVPVP